MDSTFKIIKLTSSVPLVFQEAWSIESLDAIETKRVEALSHKELLQVVDMLAYDMCTDTHLYLNNIFTEDEWEDFIEHKAPMIDEIIYTAALGSDVHPDIVRDMVSIRGDYYTEQYIHISDQQSI
ncbi:MAG: hypothetical protein CTY12_01495 [Methylotenera sp.]|nr:MAG: hypothetical protein CTY12_01495 [Methylotenera sp.]